MTPQERREHEMARNSLQKHLARRQDVTFNDWLAELKDLAGDRWPDIINEAGTVYAV